MTAHNCAGDGILVSSYPDNATVQGLTITNCTLSYLGRNGIQTYRCNATSGNKASITYNNCSYTNYEGIALRNNYTIVEHNTTNHCGGIDNLTGGIHVFTETSGEGTGDYNIIRYNLVQNSYGTSHDGYGIAVDQWCDYCEVYYNVIVNSDGPGIYLYDAQHAKVYNNTIYNGALGISYGTYYERGALRFTGDCSYSEAKNNIVYCTQSGADNNYAVYIQNENTGVVWTNNQIYKTGGGNWYYYTSSYQGTNISTWNGYTVIGTDAYGDPLFTDAANGDFSLQSGSPCINAGTNVSLSTDYLGNSIDGNPDMGAYEYKMDYTFTADSGSYSITGTAATLTVGRITHYVDNTIGSAHITAYNHTTFETTGGSDSCYRYISDLPGSFGAGTQILFRKGQTWRETLTVPSSGTDGNVITFGAFGSGAAPIISGANLVTSWTDNSTGSYDWNFTMDGTTPFEWTSETDASSKLAQSQTSPHSGSNCIAITNDSTALAYLTKTGLTSPTDFYYVLYFKISSDFSISTTNGQRVNVAETKKSGDSRLAVAIQETDHTNHIFKLRTMRNKPSWTDMGVGSQTISLNTWHKLELRGLNLTSSSGGYYVYLDDTLDNSATGLNFTSQNGDANSCFAGINYHDSANAANAGTLYIDDGYYDADGTGGGTANTWKSTVTTEPQIVVFNGTRGTKVASVAACNGDKKWYWASNTLYTYGTVDPNTTYPSQIEAGARNNIIANYGLDYVTIDGLNLHIANSQNVESNSTANYFTVQNCTVDHAFYSGIAHYVGTYFAALNNTVSNCGGCGITSTGDGVVSNTTISGNTISGCGWNSNGNAYATYNGGIKIWGGANYGSAGQSDTALIEHNTVHDCVDSYGDMSGTGIWVDQWGGGCVVRYNKVYNCTGTSSYGIVFENNLKDASPANTAYYNIVYGCTKGISVNRDSSGISILNNTVYGCTGAGLICEGVGSQTDMDNNVFRNNISYGNGRALSCKLGGENAGSGSGNVYEYNCLGPEATNFIEWGTGTYKSTYAAWESSYGGTTHSIQADPLMTDPANGNFIPQVSSPCINAGVNVSLTADYLGNSIVGLPDLGAYETNYTLYTLTAAPGSYAITGTGATLLNTHILSAGSGSYAQTGTAAGLLFGHYLSAAAGSYGIAATNVTLLRSRVVSAAAGEYTITGTDAATLYKRIMVAATEAYALTGTDASLLFGRLVGAAPGTMAITGTAAALLVGHLLSPDPGSYAVTAPDVGTYYGRLVVASPDSYVITPVAVGLIYASGQNPLTYTLTADPGSYALTGVNANVLFGRVLTGSVGSYDLAGTDIAALKTWLLRAAPDSYVVTGTGVRLIYSGVSTNSGKKMSIEIDIAL